MKTLKYMYKKYFFTGLYDNLHIFKAWLYVDGSSYEIRAYTVCCLEKGKKLSSHFSHFNKISF